MHFAILFLDEKYITLKIYDRKRMVAQLPCYSQTSTVIPSPLMSTVKSMTKWKITDRTGQNHFKRSLGVERGRIGDLYVS